MLKLTLSQKILDSCSQTGKKVHIADYKGIDSTKKILLRQKFLNDTKIVYT